MPEKFFFHDITLEVPNTVYYPLEDSILLAEAVKAMPDLHGKKCLEIGCGAGLASMVMAKKGCTVTAADVDEEAVMAVKENAAANNVSVDAVKSDLFDSIDRKAKFDLIVFNPPYLPEGQEEYMEYLKDVKHHLFGGKTGRELVERFLKEAGFHLARNGRILLHISTATGVEKTVDACNELGYTARIIKRKKIPWEELVVLELRMA